MNTYRLYGLDVRSEVDLPADPSIAEQADLTIESGNCDAGCCEVDVPARRPQGDLLAEAPDLGRGFWVVSGRDGYLARYGGVAEVHLDAGLTRAEITVARGEAPSMAGVLAAGSLFAVRFFCAGEPVWHASAVATDRGCAALLGASGAGKSTLAALLCERGASLVTDDLLRVRVDGDRVYAFAGTRSLRLRKGSAAAVPAGAAGSPDGRDVVTPAPSRELEPLDAIVVPSIVRGREPAPPRRLAAADAAMALVRFPRVLGWREPAVHAATLRLAATIAARVPVTEVELAADRPADGLDAIVAQLPR